VSKRKEKHLHVPGKKSFKPNLTQLNNFGVKPNILHSNITGEHSIKSKTTYGFVPSEYVSSVQISWKQNVLQSPNYYTTMPWKEWKVTPVAKIKLFLVFILPL